MTALSYERTSALWVAAVDWPALVSLAWPVPAIPYQCAAHAPPWEGGGREGRGGGGIMTSTLFHTCAVHLYTYPLQLLSKCCRFLPCLCLQPVVLSHLQSLNDGRCVRGYTPGQYMYNCEWSKHSGDGLRGNLFVCTQGCPNLSTKCLNRCTYSGCFGLLHSPNNYLKLSVSIYHVKDCILRNCNTPESQFANLLPVSPWGVGQGPGSPQPPPLHTG